MFVFFLLKLRGKIGGFGKIVEIDESLFTKRKSHAGRVLPQQCLVGYVVRLECFFFSENSKQEYRYTFNRNSKEL